MTGRLENKIGVITGAGSGIGKAMAILFASEGAKVIVADINRSTGQSTVEAINASGCKATFVYCDVSKFNDVDNLVKIAEKTYGKLDVMVNNAGIGGLHRCADTTLEEWDRGMAVDLNGVFYGCKCSIPVMLKNGGGSIINVSSVSGLFGDYGMCWYNAAKGGVANLTRNIALDYARHGIRCNAINPGLTLTGIGDHDIYEETDLINSVGRNYPMGRPGSPKEVAYCALFLASDESSIVNGVNLICDGGITAHTGQPDFGYIDEYLARKPVRIPPEKM